ncbi:MAG: hypothetical protein JWM80_6661 [Cyanobacteria bacterium RYN_339]|nr:hypothetical protein [Cyanobacteria bacterium RYN_339]
MSIESKAASAATHDVMGTIGEKLGGAWKFLKELAQGNWVTQETWRAKSGVTKKVFANGVTVIERPGKKALAAVPKEWLEDSGAGHLQLKQILQGSWVTSEATHFPTGETKKTFANGVEAVLKPGRKPIVTVPKTWLTNIGR